MFADGTRSTAAPRKRTAPDKKSPAPSWERSPRFPAPKPEHPRLVAAPSFDTECVHAGFHQDATTGAVVPPIHLATTFGQSEPGKHKGYEYARTLNPTRKVFEDAMRQLEGGKRGLAFSSGMAATDTLLRLLRPGDHVVAPQNLYGGTHRLFSQVLAHYGLTFSYVDTRDTAKVAAALKPETRLVFLETPTNPNLYLTDLQACTEVVRDHGGRHGTRILVVVDNTFATPYNQRPITMGADVVLHSATKYLGGHSDVVGGALVVNDDALGEHLHWLQNCIGGVMDPFSAYLAHRGLKTLAVRLARQAQNATALAEHLETHAKVEEIWYPGLPSNDQYALAKRQMRTPGAMVSFEVRGGLKAGLRVMKSVQLWTLAESLGAVESLIDHPATMTHGAIPKAEREASGLTDGLIRLSVGVEDAGDLIEDLEQALAKA